KTTVGSSTCSRQPMYKVCIVILSLFLACRMSNEPTTNDTQSLAELNKLNELLRDSFFAAKIANYHEAGYADATGTKQSAPAEDLLIKKSFKEEKVAINLAGFYAVECGIGAICKETGK